MPRIRANFGVAVLLALLCVLMLRMAPASMAQGVVVDAAWRQMLKRPPAPPPSPPDNPLTPDKVALGARLFSDARLSGKGDRSCASCHRSSQAFTDGRRRARAHSGAPLRRNTPSLWNLAWGKHFFWDGRAPSLETQVGMPIEEPQEMGGDWPTILHRLEGDDGLVGQLRAAFPDEPAVSRATVSKALASYVRSLVSPPTRFDAWIEGDAQALRPAEVRGFGLFVGKAGCVLCHVGWRFTDDRFHDIGLPSPDGGRGAVPGGTPGLSAFKTPGLRDLVHTAPYMHDGSLATLQAVIRHYTGGFVARPSLATHINRALRLSPQEKADLIAFLRTLSSEPGPARERRTGPD
jgi:cytochrome c peroxidase